MCQEELNSRRDRTRQLCAERGLGIVPYGNAWWIVGEGISLVVTDLAGVRLADLEPRAVMER